MKDENAHMLAKSVYNAFILVPLYIGMTHKTDLHIHGCVSKILYRNINNYLQQILCNFSDELSRINITVDGFKDEEDADPKIIGTGFSCGVDSLTSVYNRYVLDDDPEYRINGLFFYSNGMHGAYGDPKAEQLFAKRYKTVKAAADKIGLPMYVIDTNIHGFYKGLKYTGTTIEYIGGYSCILALERGIKMYYMPSTYSYKDMMKFGMSSRGIDFAEFAEHYAVPLIRTKNIQFIPEGGQLERSGKTEQIADWDVAQGYINVCVEHKDVFDTYEIHQNCSHCGKCVRTLLPLDALGKLDKFSGPFDIERYKKDALMNKCLLVLNKDTDPFTRDNYDFCKAHGMKLPSVVFSLIFCIFRKPKTFIKWFMYKLLPEKTFRRIIMRRRQNDVQKRLSKK